MELFVHCNIDRLQKVNIKTYKLRDCLKDKLEVPIPKDLDVKLVPPTTWYL